MLHVLHKLPYNRRRKAYRLSQMIKRSFQHTAFSCGRSIRCRPKLSIAAIFMHLSMPFPNGERAGIQGLLTSMSCPCLGQVSNYWHRGLSRGGIIDIFGWERLKATERAQLQNGGIRSDGGWVDSKKGKTLHVFLLLQNTEFWILSCFRN